MNKFMPNFQSAAPHPSYVTLTNCGPPFPTLLDFLDARFPKVGREVWRLRLATGKISDNDGQAVTLDTPYIPHTRLCYYREVAQEPQIPFQEEIVFHNEHLLVACKPHFLPVTPSGPYVNECLLYRLKKKIGVDDIVPIHRIDRETAGLVMFSLDKSTRGLYHDLFCSGQMHKVYEAIAILPTDLTRREWLLKSRIVRGDPWFRVRHEDGTVNAITRVTLLDRTESHAYFRLEPFTGKQHQLRLQLTLLGCQILYDRYYPVLQPKQPDDYNHPLQLLAKELDFLDPLTQQFMQFRTTRSLNWEKSQT
ncbi:hypothetical protein U27_00913 [Candidatus Vecturithrix granuli]|uniref:Pseudouridine synthase RsuA/RluA-like domain-containing protein n=1 Tax=Vecturithrix granuli TaxID=1499967 RepID=A0A081C8W0_VECG1|nr:hypothetical protein U27_00913 [Candidatus Vecturithrix granuli]